MAFLDDLKKEAEAKRLKEQSETQSKLVAVSQNFLLVQTKYRDILRYLQEFANQLNVMDLGVKRSYFIEGVGVIDNFQPKDYGVSVDSIRISQKDFVNTINFRFRCTTDKDISLIDMQKDYLWQNNVKYECTEYKNERGLVNRAIFKVSSEIPVSVKFTADFENARINLLIKNLNGLTVNEFTYDANEIDQKFMDELAKYLLDKPNTFRSLGEHQQRLQNITKTAKKDPESTYVNLDQKDHEELDSKDEKKGFFDRFRSMLQ
jgi:hypothetical protein